MIYVLFEFRSVVAVAKYIAGSLELLIEAGADVDTICLTYEGVLTTPLMTACEVKCCNGPLQLLLMCGADPCKGAGGALHPAISSGQVDKCRLLLLDNTDVLQLRNARGQLPLFAAVDSGISGDLDIVKLLHEEHGLDLLCTDEEGSTLLHKAVLLIEPQPMMTYLLQRGISVNAVDRSGAIALHLAAEHNGLAAVKLLIARDADLTVKTRLGLTALSTAVAFGKDAVAQALIDAGAEVAAAKSSLFGVVRAGMANTVELLLRNGMPTTVRSSERGYDAPLPPLAVAVIHGKAAVVKVLLAAGADTEAVVMRCNTFHSESTVLHIAAASSHLECVRLLLDAGANVGAITRTWAGVSVLHLAVKEGSTAVLQLLLERCEAAGVLPAVMSTRSLMCGCCGHTTPLMFCTEPDKLKLLLAAGADANSTSNVGVSALQVAAAHGHPAAVLCLLIKAGADLHYTSTEVQHYAGMTAADIAAQRGHTLAAALLRRAAEQQ
jgi:ankyrin repeat protein